MAGQHTIIFIEDEEDHIAFYNDNDDDDEQWPQHHHHYGDDDATVQLSDLQEKLLALLPILSALLSICGSCAILFMIYRQSRRKKLRGGAGGGCCTAATTTPYTRLLMGMSICDILLSLHLSIGNFLRPHDSSTRVWAFGNDTTCTASGFLTQFTQYSAILYNAMLSFYFLLAARFGIKNEVFVKRGIEPMMHIISLGFPLVTATVGVVKDYYAELEMAGFGCWVSDLGKDCDGGQVGAGDDVCNAKIIVWFFGATPYLLTALAIMVNNLIIFIFVYRQTMMGVRPRKRRRKTTRTQRRQTTRRSIKQQQSSSTSSRKFGASSTTPPPEDDVEIDLEISVHFSDPGGTGVLSGGSTTHNSTHNDEEGEYDYNDEDDDDSTSSSPPLSSFGTPSLLLEGGEMAKNHSNGDRDDNHQLRRLRLVRSQALLFVSSYVICNAWTGIILLIESSADTPQEEMEAAAKYYGFSVLQAILLPLQGFFNMLVYVRPKYLKCRHGFPEESKLWAFRRAMYGEEIIEPTAAGGGGACGATPVNTSNDNTKRTGRIYKNDSPAQNDGGGSSPYRTAPLLPPCFEAPLLLRQEEEEETQQYEEQLRASPKKGTSNDNQGAKNETMRGDMKGEGVLQKHDGNANEEEPGEKFALVVVSDASSSSSSRPTTTATSTNRLAGVRDIAVSSLTISEVDCEEGQEEQDSYGIESCGRSYRYEENTTADHHPQPALSLSQHDERWDHTEQDLSSWIPMKQGPRMLSSLRSSSLGVISELSEVSFCEDVITTTGAGVEHSTSSASNYDDVVVDHDDGAGAYCYRHYDRQETDPTAGQRRWCTDSSAETSSRGSTSTPRPLSKQKYDSQSITTRGMNQQQQQQNTTSFSISLRKPERTESSSLEQLLPHDEVPDYSESNMDHPTTTSTSSMDAPMHIPKRRLSNPSSSSAAVSPSTTCLKMPQRTESVEEDIMVLPPPCCYNDDDYDNDDIKKQQEVASCSSFDRMEAVSAPPSDRSTDSPIRVPTRRLSPTPV